MKLHFDAKINNRNHIKAIHREIMCSHLHSYVLPMVWTTIILINTSPKADKSVTFILI
ncbi:MAG: hypothetical protein ACI86M_001343 [Saprospiraceae bacterium]|jgi:hypothetical protein